MADDRWSTAWHPAEVAGRLAGFDGPWWVADGWAVDLFLDRHTRDHDDIEIGMPAALFPTMRACLPDHAVDAVGNGQITRDADDAQLSATFQTWLRDPCTDRYVLDVFREPHDGDIWVYRRDPRIRLPFDEVIAHSSSGVLFLVPELLLLFKSADLRPKDQADLAALLPTLTAAARERLDNWLGLLHSTHRWLGALQFSSADPAGSPRLLVRIR